MRASASPGDAAVTASGIAADGTWTPAFKGQRPPFSRGNKAARRHGARDPAVYGPVADKIAARFLDSNSPPWIRHPLMQPVLRAYAEQQARAEILIDYLDNVTGWPWCPCEHCMTEDDETRWRLWPLRHGAGEAYYRASTRAMYLLRDLGPCPDPRPGSPSLQAAGDYGYTRPGQKRDHRGRFTRAT